MGRVIALVLISFLAHSCAQVGVPTGGVDDKTPPQVISTVPEIGATNVSKESGGTIAIEFDEYVNVRQLSAQLLISPPLSKPVEWDMKGKTVYISWNEELQEDKTYIFQFGDAIIDVNESNAASDLMVAFSTGNQLDTLSISGRVEDVFTDEKQKDRRVFIYDWDLAVDSIAAGALPLFVTTTNEKGEFTVNYMPEGIYRALSIDDVDRNYVWTDGESLALYQDSIVVKSHDTLDVALQMQKTHDTEVKYFVNTYRDSLGLVKLELSGELDEISEIEVGGLDKYSSGTNLWVWGRIDEVEESTIIWQNSDTLIVAEESLGGLIELEIVKAPEGKQVSGQSATLEFSRPITFIKPEKFILTRADSIDVEVKDVLVSSTNPFAIEVFSSFGRGDVVELTMLPGAVEGAGRQILTDTISKKWSTFKLDELSELVVDINAEGWLELISANGTVVEVVELFDSDSQITFKNLTPGSYALRWMGDPNGNGVWDGVSLKEWRLPEPARVMQNNIKVKADWTHEVSWDIQEATR